MRVALLLSLFLVPMLAGCTTPPDSIHVTWNIVNEGPVPIDFRATIGGDDHAELTGRVVPGQTLEPTTRITGWNFTAEIAIAGDARASAGLVFGMPMCSPRLRAVWDGEGWMMDAQSGDCA